MATGNVGKGQQGGLWPLQRWRGDLGLLEWPLHVWVLPDLSYAMASLPPGLLHYVLRCSINMWIVLLDTWELCCSPHPISKSPTIRCQIRLSLLCFCTTASLLHPRVATHKPVAKLWFQLSSSNLSGTCGHFQVPSLPYETREALSICSGSLSLLNNTITSFFFFLCHGWPMLSHFPEFKIKMGKKPFWLGFPLS